MRARTMTPRTTEAPAPGTPGTYTVRASDTLTSIAREKYHNGDLWQLIYKANKAAIGARPDHLREGMKLTLPAKPGN